MLLWEIAASLDLPVFPCRADKTPACAHGFKDATRDREQIRELFACAADAVLIGVPTGEVSGFDVLDLDTTRHPEAALWMQQQQFPPTRVHKTKSGGYHLLFNHYPGLRNWTARPVLGVDGRADGGYVVYWPAMGFQANSRPILEWPANLYPLFAVKAKAKAENQPVGPISDTKLLGIMRAIGNAANGERNDLLFWGACRVAEWIDAGELTRGVGERVLMSAATHCGLSDIEASKTIASAFTFRVRHGNPAH